jgi:hypothetical protein
MDFITDLLLSEGFDAIKVTKDRLTKMAHFSPCRKTITSSETANLFIKDIVRLHGLPNSIVSDRDPRFRASFFQELFKILGVSIKMSTTNHPQTDGSTEVLNQVIEQYLRIFCNSHQNDWVSKLPLSEFTYNNTINSSINSTPFYANYGFHPRFDQFNYMKSTNSTSDATVVAQDQEKILNDLQTHLLKSQKAYTLQANKKRQQVPPTFQIGNPVFLSTQNLNLKNGVKKLNSKFVGPFKIIGKINDVTYKLDLPAHFEIHNVFHSSLLEPAPPDSFAHQNPPKPPPELINDVEEFVVETILKHRKRYKKLQYLIKWLGHDVADMYCMSERKGVS